MGDPPCSFRVCSSCILFCNAQSPSDRPLCPRHPVQSIHSIRRHSHSLHHRPLQKEEDADAEGETASSPSPAAADTDDRSHGPAGRICCCYNCCFSHGLCRCSVPFALRSPQRLCFGWLQLFFLRPRGHRGLISLPQLLPPVPQPHLTTAPPPQTTVSIFSLETALLELLLLLFCHTRRFFALFHRHLRCHLSAGIVRCWRRC